MTRDEENIIVFALRYTYGRRTYAFSVVSGYIKEHIDEFKKHDLEQMAEETREAVSWHSLPEWEKAEYISFAELLEEAARNKKEGEP